MMNKDEAVQKLATAGRLSIAHAEDLYDSIVPKPVIPWYIADYLEKVKSEGDLTVVGAVNEAPEGRVGEGIANTLVTGDSQGVVTPNFRIRKLTPRERWRLQGFPDWAFDKAQEVNSNSQLYKQAGNSVTVNVIKEIARYL